MRSATYLLGVLLVAGAGAVLVRGQPDRPADPGKGRTITATGTGTADGQPDTVRVHLGVRTFAPTMDKARATSRAAVQRVRAAVDALNLPDPKTRTTDSQVQVRHTNQHEVTGYELYEAFTVRVADPDPQKLAGYAERVLDAGLANGANSDGRIEFFLADDTALRRKAMTKAVEDARAAAAAYAAGAGVTVAEVVSVEDTQTWYGAWGGGLGNNVQAVGGVGQGGTLSAGNWTARSTVRVVFRY